MDLVVAVVVPFGIIPFTGCARRISTNISIERQFTRRPPCRLFQSFAPATALITHAPIDGLIGFSGGCMPAAIAIRQLFRETGAARALKFACFFSGYLPQNLPEGHPYHALLDSPPCALPTLHVNGTNDPQVRPAINKDLERRCLRCPTRASQDPLGTACASRFSARFARGSQVQHGGCARRLPWRARHTQLGQI